MRCLADRPPPSRDDAHPGGALGLLAARALLAELRCFPKPGLVSLRDRGANGDMDAALFVRSIRALGPYYAALARAGFFGGPFGELRRIGRDAEGAMLRATNGVNTHRGAIFSLGLLAAGAGACAAAGVPPDAAALPRAILSAWGDGLAAHAPPPGSHGARARARFGVPGAPGEAARGFPALFGAALPALERALARGCGFNRAMTQAFFSVLAVLDDTAILHRAGLGGLVFAQGCARGFLAAGGVFDPGWRGRAERVHAAFVQRGLNPGGAGDMLACAAFAHFWTAGNASSIREDFTTEDTEGTEVRGGHSHPGKKGATARDGEEAAWASR